MLTTWIEEHPLRTLIPSLPGPIWPGFEDREAWDGIAEEDRADLLQLAEKYCSEPYPMLLATQFMAFVRDGSRRAFEEPYFFRRRKLIAAAVHCCVAGGLEQLDQVINGLWCICEETSWVISAHNVNSIPGARPAAETPLPDPERVNVDLFAAQTAMILALIAQMLEGPLNDEAPVLCRRVRQEIQQRVLSPFMAHDDYWWMGYVRSDLNNWTPWIVSNVMVAACAMETDRLRLCLLLERACRMLQKWIDCLPQDGGCDEGAGYWNMAGGAMLDCLELLEGVTEGQMSFWNNEKIRNILSFPASAQLGNGWFVNFADCDARPLLCGERIYAAGQHLGNEQLIYLGMQMFGRPSDEIADVPHLTRLLSRTFCKPGDVSHSEDQTRDVWLPDLQLRVKEEQGLVLCAKGGHNGESHNHNDVGSFMLFVDGEPVIVDAGNMVYTAKTFSDERYTLWNTRSAYHNLPLIGEYEQQPGVRFAADEVKRIEYGMELDIQNAYPQQAGLIRFTRMLSVRYGMLMLMDDIALKREQSVTWVFMLRHKPEWDGENGVNTGPVNLGPSVGNMKIDIEEIPVTDPRMARNYPGSLWRVMFTAPPAKEFSVGFVVTRRES